jgi:hypothetical protein
MGSYARGPEVSTQTATARWTVGSGLFPTDATASTYEATEVSRSPVPRLAYSISELIQTGIAGRSKLYEMLADNRLTAVKIGGSTRS